MGVLSPDGYTGFDTAARMDAFGLTGSDGSIYRSDTIMKDGLDKETADRFTAVGF